MSVTDDDIRDILTETRVIALVGWANRFLILAFCAWVTLTAWFARKVNS